MSTNIIKKHILLPLFMILCICFVLSGCSSLNENEKITDDKRSKIYYLNENEDGLSYEIFTYKSVDTKANVEQVLNALESERFGGSSQTVIPANVNKPEYELTEDDGVNIRFDGTYSELTGVRELFTRAAIILSLYEIPGVKTVQFFVGDEQRTFFYNDNTGAISGEAFVDIIHGNVNGFRDLNVVVYYPDKNGNKLVRKDVTVTSFVHDSKEEAVMDALISSVPDSTDILGGINQKTKVNKITTKGGICYVDLSSAFLNKPDEISDEAYVYSVVNSLTELPGINKVFITIDGEETESFRDKISFNIPLDKNLDLISSEQ